MINANESAFPFTINGVHDKSKNVRIRKNLRI